MDSSKQNNPSHNNSKKKGKGRQKIRMEKIQNETNLQITFSKRLAGLFKKASELSILCGAESAIVVFSPSKKSRSFGNPDVETITNRFLHQTIHSKTQNDHKITASNAIMRQRYQDLTNLEIRLELEKKRRQEYKSGQIQNGSPPDLDGLTYQELDELSKSIMIFKQNYEMKEKNAKLLANSYVQGSNPNAGIGASFPMTNLGGPIINFSKDLIIQEPNYNIAYLYDNNEAILTGGAPFGFDGSPYPSIFEIGTSSNANVVIPNNSKPTNPIPQFLAAPRFIDPYDPMTNNIGLKFKDPQNTTSSNLVPAFYYNHPSELMTFGTGISINANHFDTCRTTNVDRVDTWISTNAYQVHSEDTHGGIQVNFQDKSQGLPDNYGREN